MIDEDTFTVRYDGKSCVLRNTKEFSFFRALSKRPGVYVPVDKLIEEVWDGQRRSPSAIKTVAYSLRRALKGAGIDQINIDGKTNRHHYALILP